MATLLASPIPARPRRACSFLLWSLLLTVMLPALISGQQHAVEEGEIQKRTNFVAKRRTPLGNRFRMGMVHDLISKSEREGGATKKRSRHEDSKMTAKTKLTKKGGEASSSKSKYYDKVYTPMKHKSSLSPVMDPSTGSGSAGIPTLQHPDAVTEEDAEETSGDHAPADSPAVAPVMPTLYDSAEEEEGDHEGSGYKTSISSSKKHKGGMHKGGMTGGGMKGGMGSYHHKKQSSKVMTGSTKKSMSSAKSEKRGMKGGKRQKMMRKGSKGNKYDDEDEDMMATSPPGTTSTEESESESDDDEEALEESSEDGTLPTNGTTAMNETMTLPIGNDTETLAPTPGNATYDFEPGNYTPPEPLGNTTTVPATPGNTITPPVINATARI